MNRGRSLFKKHGFFTSVNFKLYCFYGFSTWTEQIWMFAAGMAFGSLGGDLQLAASAGFAASAAILIFGPVLGRWIDNSSRLKAALLSILCTKIFACINTALLGSMLMFGSALSEMSNGGLLSALSVVCIFANMVSILSTSAARIIITKDWVVVVCQDDQDRLTATNAVLSRINLISLIVSPYLAGQIMDWTSVGIGCFVISVLIILTLILEYPLLYAVHKAVPELTTKATSTEAQQITPLLRSPEINSENATTNQGQPRNGIGSFFITVRGTMLKFLNIWRVYSHQNVLLAGISLALLYMTVLGFDSITDVYAASQGLKANTVALVKGAGALAGILGTFAYPRIRKRVGLLKTGVIALVFEIACLILPVVSVWLPGSPFDPKGYFASDSTSKNDDFSNMENCTAIDAEFGWAVQCDSSKLSIIVFLIGLVLSRFGLWMSDLTINQLFQETVVEIERASVNSVQYALNNLMDMLKSILVIFMPSPKTFGLLTILSWLFVFSACVCYLIFAKKAIAKRGKCEQNGRAATDADPVTE